VLRVDDVVVAVIAGESRSALGVDLEFPDLECFACDRFLEMLRNRDGVGQPIGAAFIGDVFGAVRE
jgi:hypothetical protein